MSVAPLVATAAGVQGLMVFMFVLGIGMGGALVALCFCPGRRA